MLRSMFRGVALLLWTEQRAHAEETKHVSVRGLAVYPALDESGPLLDKRAKLILRKGHSVEISKARISGNLLDAKLDLSEKEILVVVQVRERDLDDASLQTVRRRLETSSTVNNCLSEVTLSENSRCLQRVPVLSRHGVDAAFGKKKVHNVRCVRKDRMFDDDKRCFTRKRDRQSIPYQKQCIHKKKCHVNMFNMNEHTKYRTNRKYESQSHSIEARKRSRDFILRE